jgi:hypothetical protein
MVGIFEAIRQFWKDRKAGAEPQKQLPGSSTVKCGLCDLQIEVVYPGLYQHWLSHKEYRTGVWTRVQQHDGPLRSNPVGLVKLTGVFIVKRPDYHPGYKKTRFDLSIMTAEYFAFAIIALKEMFPTAESWHFIPVCNGDTGEYMKTLLAIVEWVEDGSY